VAAGIDLDLLDWRRRVFALYMGVRAESDPADGHRIWCEGRDDLLHHHRSSPVPTDARPSYNGADVADYDPDYRFVVEITPAEPSRRVVSGGGDGDVVFERSGRVTLDGLGSLDVWALQGYGGGLFLPIRDTAERSYGGGRYILDTVKGADLGVERGLLVVDLNFAYQPSCAYSPEWVCPLPDAGNRLDVDVPVGEGYVDLGAPDH
jgi:uncharacterized protein